MKTVLGATQSRATRSLRPNVATVRMSGAFLRKARPHRVHKQHSRRTSHKLASHEQEALHCSLLRTSKHTEDMNNYHNML
jgi:hypothetical protein